MIAAPSSASSASVASTGKVLTLSAPPVASSGETKRPPSSLRTGCVESRLAASAPARSRPTVAGVVLWTHSITRQRPSPRSSADIRTRPCSAAVLEGLDVRLAGQVGERAPRRLEAPRHRLMAVPRALQEAHLAGQHRIAVRARDALHAQLVEGRGRGLGVGRRVDDPERGRRRVLGRARRVRDTARSPRRAACRGAPRARRPRQSSFQQRRRRRRRRTAAPAAPCGARARRACRRAAAPSAPLG